MSSRRLSRDSNTNKPLHQILFFFFLNHRPPPKLPPFPPPAPLPIWYRPPPFFFFRNPAAPLPERLPRLRDVRAPSRLPAGRGAQRLHRDLGFRDGRRRLRPARDRLELRQRAHDLLPRLVQSRP